MGLAREVLRLRGTISRDHPWEIMPDPFFYRDPEEVEKEEKEAQERAKEETASEVTVGGAPGAPIVPPVGQQSFAAPTEDWAMQKTEDWSAEPAPMNQAAAPSGDQSWGGSVPAESWD